MRFQIHAHVEHVVAEWRDTAGLLWREYRCTICGRLRRSR